MKKYSRLADAFTPMAKGMGSEYSNQNAYDSVQVHGGSGFMKDYACERIYRDARITSIYEGTTQLQVVAAIRHVTTGTYLNQIRAYENENIAEAYLPLKDELVKLTDIYAAAVEKVTSAKDSEYLDFMARRLVEMAGNIIMSYLLILDASRNEEFDASARVYNKYSQGRGCKARRIHQQLYSFGSKRLQESIKFFH